MAIGVRGQGASQAVASGLMTMPAPASQGATDINIVSVVVKPFSATVTTPSGWTKIGEVVNGAVASGADVGSVRVLTFIKEGVTGSAAVTVSGSNTAIGIMSGYTRGGSENWYAKATTGFDATNGANYSATGETNLLGNTGDWIVPTTGINTDAGGISASLIAAAGLTLSATTLRSNTTSGTGDDAALMVADCSVTGGTETAAPVYTYTDANNNSGATIFILLRVVTASITSVTSGSGFATTDNYYQITATGLDTFNEWEIVRTSTSGYPEESVRGGGRQPGTNSSAVLNDYEFHYSSAATAAEENIQYRLDLYINGLLFASLYDPVVHSPLDDRAAVGGFNSQTYPTVWLKSPEMPEFNQPVVIKDFTTYSQETPILGEHHVLGRKYPVVITDLLGGISGSFEILVYDAPTWKGSLSALGTLEDINGLFSRGDVCFFQSTFPYVSGIPDFYFIPTSVQTTREQRVIDLSKAAPAASDSPVLTITVEFREVERPSTLDMAVLVSDWEDVKDGYGTWQAVKDGNASWLSLLQN